MSSESKRGRSTRELARLDHAFVWHPFTAMGAWLERDPLIIERGQGCELIDTDGNHYLDGVSSLWVNVHGHRHPRLDAALQTQLERLAHSTFLGLSHPTAIELAERLAGISPGPTRRAFYSENGAAAVEVALKMAYSYWRNQGQHRPRFVRLAEAYHGDTIGAISVGGIDRFHEQFRPLLFATESLPSPNRYRWSLTDDPNDCVSFSVRLLDEILTRHVGEVAALIIEPRVQGAAGIITAPDGHLRALWDCARAHGVLFIADEVATGFGRTGRMFACEHEDVAPDIVCMGKGITGGYLPLSVTMASEQVFEAFLAAPEQHKTLYHGHSYSANPLCCAVALANLELFEAEGTLDNMQPRIRHLRQRLLPLSNHPMVGDVRQQGFMVGIELVADKLSKQPFGEQQQIGSRVSLAARSHGAIVRNLGDVIVLMPPLVMTESQIDRLVSAVAAAIDDVLES